MDKKDQNLAKRNVFSWKRSVYWHGEGILKKLKKPIATGVHSFSLSGLFYDLLIENNNSETTIFFFHANIQREGKELPFFMCNRVLSSKKVNRVFISDPSLLMSNNLSLAWYSGVYKSIRVQEILLKIIQKVSLKLNSKKNIFFGPSNGSYAALYFSWFFPNSLAFVMNPQTRIADFSINAVKKFVKECLSLDEINNLDSQSIHTKICSKIGIENNVRNLYKKKIENTVIYLQNDSDHHIELQMRPFLNVIVNPAKVKVIMGNWGDGHKAPPLNIIEKYLNYYAFDNLHWFDS